MKIEYKKDYTVTYTDVDLKAQLSLISCLELAQNMVTDYFGSFQNDNLTLTNKYNAVWVYSKTKVHFWKKPIWRDELNIRTVASKIKPIRINLETVFNDKNKENLFTVIQETCVIDLDKRKAKKLNSINYPLDMEMEMPIFNDDFQKINESFEKNDFVYEQKLFSSDIDYSKHTNNVVYIRLIMNSLENEFLNKINITDFEIHYLNESKEGEILKIYKKEKNSEIDFLIKDEKESKEIVRANLKYMKCGEKVDI